MIFKILLKINALNAVSLDNADHNTRKITKAHKDFAKTKHLDFKDIKFPVKIRDIHKLKKKIAFLVMKQREYGCGFITDKRR